MEIIKPSFLFEFKVDRDLVQFEVYLEGGCCEHIEVARTPCDDAELDRYAVLLAVSPAHERHVLATVEGFDFQKLSNFELNSFLFAFVEEVENNQDHAFHNMFEIVDFIRAHE